MANLQERRDRNGKLISYSVRVHRGRGADGRQLKPWTTSFTVQPGWSEKTAKRKAEAFASVFERQCREGLTSDTRQTFEQYAEYVLSLREQRGDSHKTLVDYRNMTRRIYPELGHIKLRDLQAHHLNSFYGKLMQPGQNKRTGGGLSAKSVLRYHRFISIVLTQAVREGLIPFNAASRAEPPRVEKHQADYLQPADIDAINTALQSEPLKWRTLVHLLMVTGARRGEVIGLRWADIDLDRGACSFAGASHTRRIGAFMRASRKRSPASVMSPSRPRRLRCCATTASGRLKSDSGSANTIRTGALCSRATMADQCTPIPLQRGSTVSASATASLTSTPTLSATPRPPCCFTPVWTS